MKVWTIANQKGGVGKTTTTVTLAGLLTQQYKRVLVIDLDPHGSLTSYFSYNPDELEESVYSLFQKKIHDRRTPLAAMLRKTGINNLDLLPASTSLVSLDRQAGMTKGMGLIIKDALMPYQNHYDHVLIDCPPTLGILMINALAACEKLIIPVQTEFLAIKGLERILNTLKMINVSRKAALEFVVVPTMFDRRTRAAMDSLEHLQHTYEQRLWQGFIPVDTKFREASVRGKPASYLFKNAKGVQAYQGLLEHLLDATRPQAPIQHEQLFGQIA
ncbi:MAG: ParA family protein [Gammaproteobacteria bacterium]